MEGHGNGMDRDTQQDTEYNESPMNDIQYSGWSWSPLQPRFAQWRPQQKYSWGMFQGMQMNNCPWGQGLETWMYNSRKRLSWGHVGQYSAGTSESNSKINSSSKILKRKRKCLTPAKRRALKKKLLLSSLVNSSQPVHASLTVISGISTRSHSPIEMSSRASTNRWSRSPSPDCVSDALPAHDLNRARSLSPTPVLNKKSNSSPPIFTSDNKALNSLQPKSRSVLDIFLMSLPGNNNGHPNLAEGDNHSAGKENSGTKDTKPLKTSSKKIYLNRAPLAFKTSPLRTLDKDYELSCDMNNSTNLEMSCDSSDSQRQENVSRQLSKESLEDFDSLENAVRVTGEEMKCSSFNDIVSDDKELDARSETVSLLAECSEEFPDNSSSSSLLTQKILISKFNDCQKIMEEDLHDSVSPDLKLPNEEAATPPVMESTNQWNFSSLPVSSLSDDSLSWNPLPNAFITPIGSFTDNQTAETTTSPSCDALHKMSVSERVLSKGKDSFEDNSKSSWKDDLRTCDYLYENMASDATGLEPVSDDELFCQNDLGLSSSNGEKSVLVESPQRASYLSKDSDSNTLTADIAETTKDLPRSELVGNELSKFPSNLSLSEDDSEFQTTISSSPLLVPPLSSYDKLKESKPSESTISKNLTEKSSLTALSESQPLLISTSMLASSELPRNFNALDNSMESNERKTGNLTLMTGTTSFVTDEDPNLHVIAENTSPDLAENSSPDSVLETPSPSGRTENFSLDSSLVESSSPNNRPENSSPDSMAENASLDSRADNSSPDSRAENTSSASKEENLSSDSRAENSSIDNFVENSSPDNEAESTMPNGLAENTSPDSIAESASSDNIAESTSPESIEECTSQDSISEAASPDLRAETFSPDSLVENPLICCGTESDHSSSQPARSIIFEEEGFSSQEDRNSGAAASFSVDVETNQSESSSPSVYLKSLSDKTESVYSIPHKSNLSNDSECIISGTEKASPSIGGTGFKDSESVGISLSILDGIQEENKTVSSENSVNRCSPPVEKAAVSACDSLQSQPSVIVEKSDEKATVPANDSLQIQSPVIVEKSLIDNSVIQSSAERSPGNQELSSQDYLVLEKESNIAPCSADQVSLTQDSNKKSKSSFGSPNLALQSNSFECANPHVETDRLISPESNAYPDDEAVHHSNGQNTTNVREEENKVFNEEIIEEYLPCPNFQSDDGEAPEYSPTQVVNVSMDNSYTCISSSPQSPNDNDESDDPVDSSSDNSGYDSHYESEVYDNAFDDSDNDDGELQEMDFSSSDSEQHCSTPFLHGMKRKRSPSPDLGQRVLENEDDASNNCSDSKYHLKASSGGRLLLNKHTCKLYASQEQDVLEDAGQSNLQQRSKTPTQTLLELYEKTGRRGIFSPKLFHQRRGQRTINTRSSVKKLRRRTPNHDFTYICQKRMDLIKAAEEGNMPRLLELVQDLGPGVREEKTGSTLLHIAAVHNQVDVVLFLMKLINPNVVNDDGQTPAHLAAMMGHTQILRILMTDEEFCHEKQNRQEKTYLELLSAPMCDAILDNNKSKVQELLKLGADPDTDAGNLFKSQVPEDICVSTARQLAIDLALDSIVQLFPKKKNEHLVKKTVEPDIVFAVNSVNPSTVKGKEYPDPLEMEVTSSEEPVKGEDIYPMTNEPRGFVCILDYCSFKDRHDLDLEGSMQDTSNLAHVFSKMGYAGEIYSCPSAEDSKEILLRLKTKDVLKEAGCLFVIINSHGVGQDRFLTSDLDFMNINRTVDLFRNSECPNMINKPKLFIFNTGTGLYRESKRRKHSQATSSRISEPLQDILCLFSSNKGYASYAFSDRGTPFYSALCSILCKHAHNKEINDIFREFLKEYGKSSPVTVPELRNIGFYNKFYFNPV